MPQQVERLPAAACRRVAGGSRGVSRGHAGGVVVHEGALLVGERAAVGGFMAAALRPVTLQFRGAGHFACTFARSWRTCDANMVSAESNSRANAAAVGCSASSNSAFPSF